MAPTGSIFYNGLLPRLAIAGLPQLASTASQIQPQCDVKPSLFPVFGRIFVAWVTFRSFPHATSSFSETRGAQTRTIGDKSWTLSAKN